MTDLSVLYVVGPDMPAGMTIAEYRRSSCGRPTRWRRFLLRVRVGRADV